jgi:hypothetical protein
MKKYLLAAVAALAIGGPAHAERVEDGRWLLLTLNWGNGEGYYAPNTDALVSFDTRRACQDRLQQELNSHRHLIGLLCIDRNSLALPE